MKLADLYNKIISKEPYNDIDIFFSDYEGFEEIPLVSRYSRLSFLKKSMTSEGVSDFLVGLSAFLVNTIRLQSRASCGRDMFIAVTFTDFEVFEDQGVIIPKIFVYPEPGSIGFLNKLKSKDCDVLSQEMKLVRLHFSNCQLERVFDFYESRFYDSASDEDIVRIFAVPSNPLSKA
ncbi:Imm15 family immunity protein [Pseudomonas lundensis]|mgnify:FL=1|uniref:Imm15 family immunity protein n=1 Tax=Pseudomonas lundensis TaxID=86185 RepID=UPI0021CCD24A|nr:Imm15 family immunity protein [Pseudomonas lundensis]